MNNAGARVGAPITPTIISIEGGNTIYIRQGEYDVEYSLDQESWSEIVWPCGIQNTSNSEFAAVIVIFTTDITLIDSNYYFIVLSGGIIFGDFLLQPNWTRPVITIADVPDYPGLINNGTSSSEGHGFVAIISLEIATRGI